MISINEPSQQNIFSGYLNLISSPCPLKEQAILSAGNPETLLNAPGQPKLI